MRTNIKHYGLLLLLGSLPMATAQAQTLAPTWAPESVLVVLAFIIVIESLFLWIVLRMRSAMPRAGRVTKAQPHDVEQHLSELTAADLVVLQQARATQKNTDKAVPFRKPVLLALAVLLAGPLAAQDAGSSGTLLQQPGIVITLVLVLIPLLAGALLLAVKTGSLMNRQQQRARQREAEQLADYLQHLEGEAIEDALLKRKAELDFTLTNNELSGTHKADDARGIIQHINKTSNPQFVAAKRKAEQRPAVDAGLSRLVLAYLGCATFWLFFGTTVGEYLGIKFVAPDADALPWLSFGRLRPVHTNAVFWGWSSLGMLGLGYYVVPTVSNTAIASLRKGWITLVLINAAVILGSLCLMAGINNAGGEYREYVWPVMALFGAGLVITLYNFCSTVARRKTHEIYISNWYIISAIIFTLVITVIAYWPGWQNGLGETIVQGYYMHQGVGMWFMLFSLGIVYYFLPQQLNKPIYSYSLGILAFWTQIIFYTLIGTHHFVFSAIPWWLQTVAIVGSAGMLIPVTAGTTNFFMTFKGAWHKVGTSYTLPFYLVGIVFYFTGSFQGTAEAFRYTNLLWHFTDFTVAHSHLTMYGIIAFLLWGSIYAVVPRLTGREPSQLLTGAHFWLAFIGLMFYTIPLMMGGTLRGLQWMAGKPFIDSVTLMAPYWLWRAIGGSLMWLSHLVFAWNFYTMATGTRAAGVKDLAVEVLRSRSQQREPVPSSH